MINTEAADPCWEEFRKYSIRNSLTGYERRILWDWIRSGYGACGTAGRGCLSRPACPRADPTDTRGPGRWLAEDTKGMAGDAAGVCLKPYGVCEDSSPEQAVMNGARRTCPGPVQTP